MSIFIPGLFHIWLYAIYIVHKSVIYYMLLFEYFMLSHVVSEVFRLPC